MDQIFCAVDFFEELCGGRRARVTMMEGVVADLVALGNDSPDQVRAARRAPAQYEEGGPGAVFFQYVKHARGVLWVRTIVKGQADPFIRGSAFDKETATWQQSVEHVLQALPPPLGPSALVVFRHHRDWPALVTEGGTAGVDERSQDAR
jgi:hypothetical protein